MFRVSARMRHGFVRRRAKGLAFTRWYSDWNKETWRRNARSGLARHPEMKWIAHVHKQAPFGRRKPDRCNRVGHAAGYCGVNTACCCTQYVSFGGDLELANDSSLEPRFNHEFPLIAVSNTRKLVPDVPTNDRSIESFRRGRSAYGDRWRCRSALESAV